MKTDAHRHVTRWWQIAILIILSPLVLGFAMLTLVLFFIISVCLRILIWSWWCLRGQNILFVYSDSPIWHDYIEQQILPYLGGRAIVLNWSRRKQWRFSLAQMAFFHFGGYRQFNPLGVVFRPLGRTHTFRFWQPFHDYKHGNLEPLHKLESEFFGLIGVQRQEPSA
jgi:hypothetical protein